MTVEQARDILQEEIQNLTDEEVLTLISGVGGICDTILNVILKNHLTPQREGVYDG